MLSEKAKLINLLNEENDYLIFALDTYDPYDKEEQRIAKLNFKSYLNVQTLLRLLTDDVKEWNTDYSKIAYNQCTLNRLPLSPNYVYKFVRTRIINILGNECEMCKIKKDFSIHHRHPLSEGGTDVIGNLALVCKKCHREIHEKY